MAAFTSKANGNWSASGQTTWNEVGVPATGDTVTYTHNITIDTNTTVGDDSTGYVVACVSTGKLTLAPAVTFTVRGGLSIGNDGLRYSKNSILEIGSTAGTVNFFTGNAFSTRCIIDCAGGADAPSAGNRATFRKRSGATQVTVGPYYYCDYDLAYVNFENIGTSSFSCADPGTYAYAVAQTFRFLNCHFTSCGPIGCVGGDVDNPNGTFQVLDCKFNNSAGNVVAWRFSNSVTTGVREFKRNVVDGVFTCYNVTDLTCRDNQFHIDTTNGGAPGVPALWSDNFWSMSNPGAHETKWNNTNTYLFNKNEDDNVHVWSSPQASITYDRVVVDMPFLSNPTDWGELMAVPLATGAYTYKLKNALILPVAVGSSSNSYATKGAAPLNAVGCGGTGGGAFHIQVEHCTARLNAGTVGTPGQSARGIIFNEGSNSSGTSCAAGTLNSIKSNLFWTTDVATQSYLVCNHGSGGAFNGVDDILTPGAGANNASYSLGTVVSGDFGAGPHVGTPYYVKLTCTPSTTDIALGSAPAFVDSTRNLLTWGRMKQGLTGRTDAEAPADIASTLALMKSINDDGGDPTYAHNYLLDWVWDGWSPTTSSLEDAGHDGVTIGAVEGTFSVSGQFAADTWSGLTAATSITGRTASDGSSVWTAHSGDFKGNGVDGVYPTAGKYNQQIISIDNNLASQANQDITWTWIPKGDPRLTGAGGWQTCVWAKVRNAQYSEGVYIIFDTSSGSGGEIYLAENDQYGGFSRTSTHSSYITSLVSTINCTLSIRAGLATLTCTGGVTFSTTLTLSIVASGFGAIGLSAYSPVGGVDATNGVHTGPILGVNYTGAATAYSILPGKKIYGGADVTYASKYPAAFYLFNQNVGNRDNGYAGNGLATLALNGVAPVGGFTFTPTGFTARDNAGNSQSTIAIAAGADVYEFAPVPPAGRITDLAVTGTNDRAFSNPSITVNVRPKACFWEGDSYSDESFGAVWPASVRTTMGSTWLFRPSAAAYTKLDDGTSVATASVKIRQAITVLPFHDATRTQEAYGIWGGTNDLFGSDSGAVAFAKLQVLVNDAKAANFGGGKIAVGTITARQADVGAGGPGQSVFETRRQDFNTLTKAAYGSTGSDTSVTVLDFGGDATLGHPDIWQNAAYYPDGTHPSGASATPIIAGKVTTWLLALPADQTVGGLYPQVGMNGGLFDMSGGLQ